MKFKKKMRIALVSMKTLYHDPRAKGLKLKADIEANLERHRYWLAKALEQEPDFVGFPEFALTGWVFHPSYCLSLNSPVVREIESMARRHHIYLATGLVERRGGRLQNTCLIAGPRGRVGVMHKINLIGLGNRYYTPGREFPVFDVAGCRMGVATCADASPYAMIHILSLRGAEVIFAPHANSLGAYGNNRNGWLRWRRGNWPTVARDSRVYIAGMSGAGLFDRPRAGEEEYKYCGGGAVVDWEGKFQAKLGGQTKREGLLVADLDLAGLRAERAKGFSHSFRPDIVYNRPRSWWESYPVS